MGLQPVKGAIEAQLAGVWLKWNPKKWYCGKVGVFPQSVFTTMSSETQKGPNTPPCFHAFFCPAVCFPLTLLPCLHASCLWLNAQTSCPGEGHRESPDAWRCEDLFSVTIQSQSDTSFSPAGSRYRAKLVDQESQYAAGSWGVGVFFIFFFVFVFSQLMTGDSYCHTVWYHVSLSLSLLSNPTFGELNERDRVCNNQPIWRSINISEAMSLMWGESTTVW